jgi:hypothetical protein
MNPEELRIMSLPKMQERFREAMGEWQDGDRGITTHGMIFYFDNRSEQEEWDTKMGRLPLPIDPRNPERGLWGMVDWVRWNVSQTATGGKLTLHYHDAIQSFYAEDTPTLALLKALAHQEGVR